jgi:hypothetical protein
VEVGAPADGTTLHNTLVLRVGRASNEELAATLRDGLAACRRDDAGLVVFVLFAEGVLNGPSDDLTAPLREVSARLEAPMVINEDVNDGWAHALLVDGDDPAWRIISPDGSILWMHEGSLRADELGATLDGLLYPSSGAQPSALQTDLGSRFVSPDMFEPLLRNRRPERPHCPPWRLHGLRPSDVARAVAFVQTGESSSADRLRRLQAEIGGRDGDEPGFMVVVDGADDAEATELGQALGEMFTVIADPDGVRAREAGVRFWPSIVSIEQPTELDVQEVTR